MKRFQKIVSFLLALVLFGSMLPQIALSVEAATVPKNVSVSEAEKKIYELFTILGSGSYFTVNQKTCCTKRESGHGCTNCSLASIIKQSWFTNKFGTLSTDQFPRTYYSNSNSWKPSGRSCFAFATFAEWYIYANANTDKVTTTCVGTFKWNYDGVSANIRTGDLIRLQKTKGSKSGHSAIVISYDKTGVTVLDCNGTGKNCEVHIRTMKFKNSSYNYYVISRATNSVVCEHKFVDNDTACGICDKCGYIFDWASTFNPADAGLYKLEKVNTYALRSAPYSKSAKTGIELFKHDVYSEWEIWGSYTNAYGNKWYALKDANGKLNFIYNTYLSKKVGDIALEATCTGFAPANNATIPQATYSLKGTVTSSNLPLKYIEAYLDGKLYATWTAPNSTTMTVNLKDTVINKNLKFASLAEGKHTIVLKAYSHSSKTALQIHSSVFTVKDTDNTPFSVTCTGFAPANNATLLQEKYNITGTVTSNSNAIKSIEGYIDGEKYATWTASNSTTKTVNLKDTVINKSLKFSALSYGKHTIKLKAINTSGDAVVFLERSFYICSSTSHKADDAVIENEVDATCTEAGSWDSVVYCSVCGKELSRETYEYEETGHAAMTIPGKAPICTDGGWTEGTICIICGVTIKERTQIPATGHTWHSATCTAPKTCSTCGTTSGSALGHNYSNNACTRCGHIAISIIHQPTDQAVFEGERAITTVVATGEGLTYQWWVIDPGDATWSKSSYKVDTYSVEMVPAKAGRRVYCVITDKYGNSVTTNTVTLKLADPVKITKQPVNVTVGKGETAKVTVSATGDGLTYKWYFKNPGSSKFSLTNSFKGNTYTISAMDAARNGRQVYCVITDKYGNTVTTNTVTLKLADPVKITKQPVNVTVASGEAVKITVTATGDGLTYKWYFKNPGGSKFSLTSTFKGSTYSISAMDAKRSGRQVYCVITDKYGNSVTTKTVTISMQTPLQIVQQPTSVTVAEGKTATVTVVAEGDGLTYRWYYKNAGAKDYTYTDSFKGNTYSVKMTDARNGRRLICRVYDQYGNVVKSETVIIKMK